MILYYYMITVGLLSFSFMSCKDSKGKKKEKEDKVLNGGVKKNKSKINDKEGIEGPPLIDDPSLPKPWAAYLSTRKMKVYYFNHITKKSVWSKEEINMVNRGEKASTSKESMDEPMDIDDYVEEIKTLRMPHRFIPLIDLTNDDDDDRTKKSSKFDLNARNIAVFDTSALLECPEIPYMTIEAEVIAVIPYTVVTELDGLKLSYKECLRAKVSRIHRHLDDISKREHPLFVLESGKEARQPLSDIDCVSNDDYILKCALRIQSFLRNHDKVIELITNDKNLSIKCRSYDMKCTSSQDFVNTLREQREERKLNEKGNKEREREREREKEMGKKKHEEEKNMSRLKMKKEDNKKEKKSPWMIFNMLIDDTSHVLYSQIADSKLHHFIRIKAHNDLSSIRNKLDILLNERTRDNVLSLYHQLHSFHQYYVIKSPFPPKKLNEDDLINDLSLNVDSFYNKISSSLSHINSLPIPSQ